MTSPTKLGNAVGNIGGWKIGIQALIALLAVVIVFSALTGMASSDIDLVPRDVPIPPDYFDLNLMLYPGLHTPWPAAPFHGSRLWHALWFDLEPKKGQWKFDHLDELVNSAQQHGSEILLMFTYTPEWASGKPDLSADWKPGTAGPLRDMNDWKDYVRTVGTRYKGKIHVYEMWNEPDRPRAWAGDLDTMVQMVREGSKILKGIDPTVTIVSPSATHPKGAAWLNEFLGKGGGQYVDVIGYHFYTGRVGAMDPPEAAIPLIQNVKSMMAQHNLQNKPLWDTEAGWLGPAPFSDGLAAAYVARAYIVNWAAGVDRFYWFQWDVHTNSSIELIRRDNSTLTPAGQAFITIQGWLTGSVMKHCLSSDNHSWVCELEQNNNWKYIIWNTNGDKSFRLAKKWRVSEMMQLDGSVSKIDGDSIRISATPLLIQ